jgi:hypothetical protein
MSEQEGEKVAARFSRREWLMAVALVAVIEAWVLNVSYAFQTEQAVISYVSFAATIASLLLAVLAIIYGFYQSDGQQKSAAAIAGQVGAMRSVQAELNDTSREISGQLAGMSRTAGELQKLSAALEATHEALGNIQGGISGLREEQRAMHDVVVSAQAKSREVAQSPDPVSARQVDVGALVFALFRATSHQADLFGVALYELAKRGETAPTVPEFINRHYAIPLSAQPAQGTLKLDQFQWYLVGSLVLSVARALKLLIDHGEGFRVADGVLEHLEAHAKAASQSAETGWGAERIIGTFTAGSKETGTLPPSVTR